LLAGLDAGLVRIGLPAPMPSVRLADLHGMLMVVGFLGTLIAVERAVALRAIWGYAAPLLLGAGAVVLVAGLAPGVGRVLFVEGSVALVAVYAALWGRNRDDTVLIELLGAVLLGIGCLLWLVLDVPYVVPWLVGFITLTIAAERVELARLTLPASAGRTLVVLACLVAVGLVGTLLWPVAGTRATATFVACLVGWLVRHDVARRTIRATGLPRFSAAALLAGYGWMLVAALAWTVAGPVASGPRYDLVVHSVFVGFAMSMVLAHAPVILPAVLRRPLPYRAVLWLPLALLHAGLLLRVGGDLALDLGGGAVAYASLRLGAVTTGAAILGFVASAVVISATARRKRTSTPSAGGSGRQDRGRPRPRLWVK
jgi:hypothetical protein